MIVRCNYHYGGLPGRPAGPAATRPIGLPDACNVTHYRESGRIAVNPFIKRRGEIKTRYSCKYDHQHVLCVF